MNLSDESLATVLLCSHVAAPEKAPLRAGELHALRELVGSLRSVIGLTEQELIERGLEAGIAARVAKLSERRSQLAFILQGLEAAGISTLTPTDIAYPRPWIERLAEKSPPVVHAAGDLDILQTAGLGVVGSRNVDAAGLVAVERVVEAASVVGATVVSGGARGVDTHAMDVARSGGLKVLGILADRFESALRSKATRRAILGGSIALCTPYAPNAGFNAGNAMGRNKLIYASSRWTVVVASDEGKGGTWNGATEALRSGRGGVAVWRGEGEGPGNQKLVEAGGVAVSSAADIVALLRGEVRLAVKDPAPAPPLDEGSTQLTLW